MSLIISILIGAFSGWLAGIILKGRGQSWIMNIIVGLIGGLLGGALFGLLGIEDTNFIGTIVISTIGSIVLLLILNVFKINP
jgi:uncharacterized membrane protein YeaQ/YmgE (transglycosylase-associated protein family)